MFPWLKHIQLRRIITSNRLIPEVDGFRFLAIFIVIAAHIYVQCNPPDTTGPFAHIFHQAFNNGKLGVYLFFAISGFILGMPFARHHLQSDKAVNIRSYFRRRLTRLEPPYIVAMLLRFPMVMLVKRTAIAATLLHLLASLFYVHNLVYNQYSTINPPAWSLEVEVQFYILAPILASVFLIRSAALRRIVLAAAILVGAILSSFIPEQSRIALTLLNYSQYFLAGFLLCDIHLLKDQPKLPRLAWDLVGFAVLAWIFFGPAQFYYILFPFFTVALYLAGLNSTILRAFFANPFVSITGGMCYSIYLTHPTVLTIVSALTAKFHLNRLSPASETLVVFILGFAATFLVGAIFYVLLERPCMDPKWPQKLAQRFRPSKAVPVSS